MRHRNLGRRKADHELLPPYTQFRPLAWYVIFTLILCGLYAWLQLTPDNSRAVPPEMQQHTEGQIP